MCAHVCTWAKICSNGGSPLHFPKFGGLAAPCSLPWLAVQQPAVLCSSIKMMPWLWQPVFSRFFSLLLAYLWSCLNYGIYFKKHSLTPFLKLPGKFKMREVSKIYLKKKKICFTLQPSSPCDWDQTVAYPCCQALAQYVPTGKCHLHFWVSKIPSVLQKNWGWLKLFLLT